MKTPLLSASILAILFLASCKKDKIEMDLVGTWVYEYEILDDGTKNYNNPGALLDFTYSDGFVLDNDGTGAVIWFNSTNSELEWSNTSNSLIIHNQYWDGELIDYNYVMTDIESTSFVFENKKGDRFYMKKQ